MGEVSGKDAGGVSGKDMGEVSGRDSDEDVDVDEDADGALSNNPSINAIGSIRPAIVAIVNRTATTSSAIKIGLIPDGSCGLGLT
jgi:hypothetical protein